MNTICLGENQAADSTFSTNEQQPLPCNAVINACLLVCSTGWSGARSPSEPKRCVSCTTWGIFFPEQVLVHRSSGQACPSTRAHWDWQPVLSGFQVYVSQILIDLQPHPEECCFISVLSKAGQTRSTCAVQLSGAQARSESIPNADSMQRDREKTGRLL